MLTTIDTIRLRKCNVDGTKCKRINVNGVKVWSYAEALYAAGDQVTDLTGGWSKHSTLMASTNQITNWPSSPTGSVSFNSSNVVLSYGGGYGGVMIHTAKAINFQEEGIDSITIDCSTVIGGWGYGDGKYNANLTYANWMVALVPKIANEQSYTLSYVHDFGSGYINGESSATKTDDWSKTIRGLSALTGSYYVVVGIWRTVPTGTFKLTVNNIFAESEQQTQTIKSFTSGTANNWDYGANQKSEAKSFACQKGQVIKFTCTQHVEANNAGFNASNNLGIGGGYRLIKDGTVVSTNERNVPFNGTQNHTDKLWPVSYTVSSAGLYKLELYSFVGSKTDNTIYASSYTKTNDIVIS